MIYHQVVSFLESEKQDGVEFVYTPQFLASTSGLLSDDAFHLLEMTLLTEPGAGDVIPGTGGIRKLRLRLPGRGKSGGARIIYLFVAARSRIYLLFAYAKNDRVDLNAADRKRLRLMAETLKREGP